ncbi:ubiquitin-conjugating enzyme/RWD-like protein [Usnea florida]
MSTSRSPTPPSNKRLLQELKSIVHDPSPILEILRPASEAEILHWEAVMKGFPGTAYEAGLWRLDILIPPSYPLAPPKITFSTPICHPNVDFKTGEICLDLLKTSWSPAYTLTSTLEAIHQLLAYPEVDSPFNVDIATLLKSGDKIGGESLVRFWCGEKRWGGR